MTAPRTDKSSLFLWILVCVTTLGKLVNHVVRFPSPTNMGLSIVIGVLVIASAVGAIYRRNILQFGAIALGLSIYLFARAFNVQ